MQITITGRHVGVGARLHSHVEKRLEAGTSKYFNHAIDAQVVFTRQARFFDTDIAIHLGSGITLQGHAETDDITASFDLAADRVEKRLRRYKRRLKDHHKRLSNKTRNSIPAQQYVLAAEPEDAETEPTASEAAAPVIVAETSTEIDVMSVGDAVMRMDLAELPALMFRNGTHGRLNVVYRRPDGNIGWIDPTESADAG